jgi:hypothetical protein
MIVAREKKQNNITEYILYMWQIEDIIRALKFDMDKIRTTLIGQYDVDAKQKLEIDNWYSNLVLMMQKEQITQAGHLQFLKNTVDDLNRFHVSIINEQADAEYITIYNQIKPDLELVRSKSGKLQHHDIQISLNTLYLILMLKMKNQDISEGTQKAVWKFGNFMGHLSKLFKAFENGDFTLETYS